MKKEISQPVSKWHEDVVRIGTKNVDHWNLNAIEATTMSVVAILAVTAGTVLGGLYF